MTLIKSIAGIRGTIGGETGNALTPIDIVTIASAYAKFIGKGKKSRIVVGRDARISGEMVRNVLCGTLTACGADVIDIGLATTPTTEMAVVFEKADGGIIITASHNPRHWNALKLLNGNGEFLTADEGREVMKIAESGDLGFVDVDNLGHIFESDCAQKHIDAVLAQPMVDVEAIKAAGFKAVLDPVNSVGAIVMPHLLEALGVECVTINGEPNGQFAHNPEPLPVNLKELGETVVKEKADIGISVDPDVDRLVLYCENGEPFGEEYTLVAVADYIIGHNPGATVSNISASRALRDVTEAKGCSYFWSAVGEVNVTTKMKEVGAVIGGEGNGGVIYPNLHYGRDALIGVALFLSHLAAKKVKASELRASYPDYSVSKNRIDLNPADNIEAIFEAIIKTYSLQKITTIDGVRIDFETEKKWVILRKSNTEPIIRVYAEAPTPDEADALAAEILALAEKVK